MLVTAQDHNAIEVALRLGIAKYGEVLHLAGPEEFKREAVRVSLEVGLDVEFADGASYMLLSQWSADAIADRLSVGFSARMAEVGRASELVRPMDAPFVIQRERERSD